MNNDLTMDLMRRIVNHTGNKGPVIKNRMMISCKTMIDEDNDDIIKNDFGVWLNSHQEYFEDHQRWMLVYPKQGINWRM